MEKATSLNGKLCDRVELKRAFFLEFGLFIELCRLTIVIGNGDEVVNLCLHSSPFFFQYKNPICEK